MINGAHNDSFRLGLGMINHVRRAIVYWTNLVFLLSKNPFSEKNVFNQIVNVQGSFQKNPLGFFQ